MLGISFHEEAQTEFDEATDFYGMERTSLGRAVIGAGEQAVDGAREYPDSCPILRGRVRKARVRRFPYSVLYSCVGNQVRVLAVAHDRRRPFYWSGRR
jgi:plasmid stabilization system protein ParE